MPGFGSLVPDLPFDFAAPAWVHAGDARDDAAYRIAGRAAHGPAVMNQRTRHQYLGFPGSANVDDRRFTDPYPWLSDEEYPEKSFPGFDGTAPAGLLSDLAGFSDVEPAWKRINDAWAATKAHRRLSDGLSMKEFPWDAENRDGRFISGGYLGSDFDVASYYDAVGIGPNGEFPWRPPAGNRMPLPSADAQDDSGWPDPLSLAPRVR